MPNMFDFPRKALKEFRGEVPLKKTIHVSNLADVLEEIVEGYIEDIMKHGMPADWEFNQVRLEAVAIFIKDMAEILPQVLQG